MDWQKRAAIIVIVLNCLLVSGLGVNAYLVNGELRHLKNQMTYLSDASASFTALSICVKGSIVSSYTFCWAKVMLATNNIDRIIVCLFIFSSLFVLYGIH